MANCEKCIHKPLCDWCAENTDKFSFPKQHQECMLFDEDLKEKNKKLTEALELEVLECERLKKENEMLWKKHTPMAVEVRVMDEEFDLKTNHCPVCGARLFVEDLSYCRECGQALKWDETDEGGRPMVAPTDDTEIGMITNVNDRS